MTNRCREKKALWLEVSNDSLREALIFSSKHMREWYLKGSDGLFQEYTAQVELHLRLEEQENFFIMGFTRKCFRFSVVEAFLIHERNQFGSGVFCGCYRTSYGYSTKRTEV